ncbi:response regulator [Thermodesulfobacteriota bacterium]
MVLKRFLGEILKNLGFVTKNELDEALNKQKEIFDEKALPERLKRDKLVSQARKDIEKIPLLGQILTEMGFVTMEQLEVALQEQQKMFEMYEALDSKKLGTAIEIGSIVNSTLNLAEVLSLIMRYANRVTNSSASTLMLLDDHAEELVFSVPTGPKAEKLIDIRIPSTKGIAGWVVEHEEAALVPDVNVDERFYEAVDKISGFETKSILCVPLKAKTKIIGVLEVINKSDGSSFDEEDKMLLSIFASQAAVAIENARLYGELKDRMEKEIEIQKKLAESEKFRALGQMASGLAHDFNNLLMGIQGNTSLMLLNTETGEPYFDRLKNIEQAVISGTDITKQLLGFAKGGKYEVEPTDLNELIERNSRMFASTKKEIKIRHEYQKGIWTVEIDRGQIEQVLLNLFINASQAMPSGGYIFLETENVALDSSQAQAHDLSAGYYVRFTVRDNGVGMDQVTRQKIFDPFFSTKGIGLGTGMGLASAYGIIRNHEGSIRVESEKGRGAAFYILLPASQKRVPETPELPEGIPKGQETILLVDDESMIIEVGKHMLEKMGYKVLVAEDGREALETYKKNLDKIHLILLDMVMPDMGGGETYDRLREINPEVRVLLSSGYSVNGEASQILQRGCDGFIQKPFNLKSLSQKLREILGSSS